MHVRGRYNRYINFSYLNRISRVPVFQLLLTHLFMPFPLVNSNGPGQTCSHQQGTCYAWCTVLFPPLNRHLFTISFWKPQPTLTYIIDSLKRSLKNVMTASPWVIKLQQGWWYKNSLDAWISQCFIMPVWVVWNISVIADISRTTIPRAPKNWMECTKRQDRNALSRLKKCYLKKRKSIIS